MEPKKATRQTHSAEYKAAELREKLAQAAKAELELEEARRTAQAELALDYHSGHIVFANEITQETAIALCTFVRRVSRLRPNQPITIDLTTPGGEVAPGFAAYDELSRIQATCPITIRVRGEAASMGAVLLQAAKTRECGANSRIMLHKAAFAIYSSSDVVEDYLKETRQIEARIYSLLGSKTKKPAVWWGEQLGKRKDLWFSAKEALELGLIDAIQ